MLGRGGAAAGISVAGAVWRNARRVGMGDGWIIPNLCGRRPFVECTLRARYETCGTIGVSVIAARTLRLVAVFLLLIAGAEAYACDVADACISGAPSQTSPQSDDCDQPLGDNCICCCHHVVPVAIFVLQPAEWVLEQPAPQLIPHLLSVPTHIDHPPQL